MPQKAEEIFWTFQCSWSAENFLILEKKLLALFDKMFSAIL
jgi:hypothetical protein